MPLPMVAIVGRPNVGKSSLLNMLAGRRISIVDPTAGVTRDRIQTVVEHEGVYFELVDTGGYGIVDRDDLGDHVERQIRYAVSEAALILFVVDAREGLTALDQAVAEWLRTSNKPTILLANKADAPNTLIDVGDFHRLGVGDLMLVSALHRRGEDELKERIVEHIRPLAEGQAPEDPVMKIALVGRRNVGKSTFINALAGQERVIVSEIPGTTRDAVDVRFERDGRTYLAIDTAGVRKKNKLADDIEYYGFHRAELSIRRADVILFLIDATSEVGQVDKRLAGYIAEQYKPCILVVNKWDLAKGRATSDDYGEYLLKTLPGLDYAPVAFTTANQGRNVQAVIDLASSLFKQSRTRVTTAELNAAIETATSENVPKPKHGVGKLKIYYGTQVAVEPPTIVLFVNDPTRVSQTYERFLTRRLHELLPYPEVPIRIMYRGRRVGEPTADRPGQGKARPESSPRKRKPAQPRRASQSTKTGKKEARRR
ncbi:MAG: ribosome biogenesis GTPase Der [Phycisphaerae bacterium]|nr:ribosome biogenesis GTPase Der [Phycisphaerae bacterium]HQA45392.1 ribosome biogenesis GTPase Der [Phycisphaerae bacterium]